MSEPINIQGGREIDAALKALPAKVADKVVRFALRAGANVIRQAALEQVPVKGGTLRDSIKVSVRKQRGGTGIVSSVRAGSRKAGGGGVFYAHMVERGTKPHRIRSRTRKILVIGFTGITKLVNHPGAKAKPFMRRALHQADRAVDAVVAEARRRLAKVAT